MPVFSYIETLKESEQSSSFNCSLDQGSATATYILSGVTDPAVFDTVITDILGNVSVGEASPIMQRALPLQHPYLPFYAQSFSMKGYGSQLTTQTSENFPWFPQVQSWPLYDTYLITVNFTPRNYPVLPDLCTNTGVADNWTQFDGIPQNFTYYPEYERFCYPIIEPSADAVTVQVGQMAFNAVGLVENSKPFMGAPRKFLNNDSFKIRWMCVPMSYYTSTNSYLKRFKGTVNQLALSSYNLGDFEPGQLLYMGAHPTPFTPPWPNSDSVVNGVSTFERFCHIDLIFSFTTRTRGADPLNPPTNANLIAAHHNLQPYFGSGGDALSGGFLYASSTPTSGAHSYPLWPSAPHQLLFCNPDSSDAV